jgi:hypothetical protein
MLIAGALIFAVLFFEVPSRIGDFGTKVMGGELSAPRAVGETAVVRGTDYRPTLEVTAGKLERTRSRTPRERAARGNVLYAVPLAIRNREGLTWNALDATKIALIDADDQRYPISVRFTKVKAGKVLPRMVSLARGDRIRGRVVFELPRSASVTSFEVKVAPGFAQVARWRMVA